MSLRIFQQAEYVIPCNPEATKKNSGFIMKFPYKATHQRTFLLNSPITCQEGCSLDNIENLTNNVYIYIYYLS